MSFTISNEAVIKSEKKKVYLPKNEADVQRLKIEKLMNKPDKPVFIPERPKERKLKSAPEFVRDVMGSSAGAGSGEFHVYRHIRRREYNRQAYLDESENKSKLDEKYHQTQENNKKQAEEATARKRAKRLRRKKAVAVAKKKKKLAPDDNLSNSKEKSDNQYVSSESDQDLVECVSGPNITIPFTGNNNTQNAATHNLNSQLADT